ANILSVHGNVLEHGMPRFFPRLAEGVFDIEDLIFRTKELHDFLQEAAQLYGFDRQRIVAIGYYNGANIAALRLFHYAD
ncbi:alpha/beta hydrolase, partial [Bacillus velezensis]|uniref:alpha/beta hydrolase n=1 Tax=Bacillus velezensis TaxID=492670 RepID=UPI003D2FFAA8